MFKIQGVGFVPPSFSFEREIVWIMVGCFFFGLMFGDFPFVFFLSFLFVCSCHLSPLSISPSTPNLHKEAPKWQPRTWSHRASIDWTLPSTQESLESLCFFACTFWSYTCKVTEVNKALLLAFFKKKAKVRASFTCFHSTVTWIPVSDF